MLTDTRVRLESDVFPRIGLRSISELATSDFRDVARNIERRGASEIARRLLQNCGQYHALRRGERFGPTQPCVRYQAGRYPEASQEAQLSAPGLIGGGLGPRSYSKPNTICRRMRMIWEWQR